MGGLHLPDLIVVIGVALLIFGPKTLQSLSRNAGRGLGQAKEAKEKIMAELPMEDISQITSTVANLPTSPQKVARMLIAPALSVDQPASASVPAIAEESHENQ